jgi:ATP-binding cassette, subfamily B, bacterial
MGYAVRGMAYNMLFVSHLPVIYPMTAQTKQSQLASTSRWRERIRALRNIAPVLGMLWRSAPGLVTTGIFIRIVASLMPLGMLVVTRLIINAIELHNGRNMPLPQNFWWLVAAEFTLACLAAIWMRVNDFCDAVTADRFMHHTSLRVMEHASTLDLASFEDPVFYDKMERARVQSTDRIGMIRETGRVIQEIITMVSLAATICFFSKWIVLALVACVVPAFLGETHFAFRGYWLSFLQAPARRELDYLRIVGGSKESAKELKLFGLGPFLLNRYAAISERVHQENVGLARGRLFVGTLLTLLGTLGYYGSYAYVIYRTITGAFSIGDMILLTGAIAGASSNIQAVFTSFSSIANQALFLTDLLDFLKTKPRLAAKPGALRAPQPIRRGFEFKHVSFRYPGSSRMILDNISFRLAPSSRVALVGENGQGKTTIVKLITRLYDPSAGQILLDGVDLREYDLESLWKEIGVIFQDFSRYDFTAADNIAVGQIEEHNNPFRIRTAATKSLADRFIRKLPYGYEQTLGCRFEGGVDLSGGEWQKLALARAYMREAQLLILDEPTASLDARSEHEVFERFAELTAGKMALLISHRFSTVRMADRILVLENGKIAEQGHHDQLVRASDSRYAAMFRLQAASYR